MKGKTAYEIRIYRSRKRSTDVRQTFCSAWARVVLSNSKGPDSLVELVCSIGPNAKAGVVKEAAKQDIVILAVR
jgi:8-hydroxy-5-deazaflavin:NADPH oxidoreductase